MVPPALMTPEPRRVDRAEARVNLERAAPTSHGRWGASTLLPLPPGRTVLLGKPVSILPEPGILDRSMGHEKKDAGDSQMYHTQISNPLGAPSPRQSWGS